MKLDDLDLSDQPLDDRWTLDRLRRAGYEWEWGRTCRTCGDSIEMYRRADGKLLLLDEAVLSPHHCEGR